MRYWLGAPWRVAKVQGRRFAAWTRLRGVTTLLPAAALPVLALLALAERPRSAWSRFRGRRPRVIWGPSAILNIRYWSAALRQNGYESLTCVDLVPSIATAEDFDVVQERRFGNLPVSLRGYAMFAWALWHGDVFMRFFDMGFLRSTPLQWMELPLTRLAGKRVVVQPYGGDNAVVGHLGPYEKLILADYPDLPNHAELLKRRVLHSLKWSDLSLRTIQVGYQPSYNAVGLNLLAIDTDRWKGAAPGSDADGRNGEVVVVHAPNHRVIKGTEHLERAIEELRSEGVKVRLSLLEGRNNEEVRQEVLAGDIVADQLHIGFGLFAVEGMSASKPVLSNLEMWWLEDDIRERALEGCPIVDTDETRVKEDLRRLIEDPDLRRDLGRRGREFAVRNHSYGPVTKRWESLIGHLWSGDALPDQFQPR